MSSIFKKSSFRLTPLDKQIFDPDDWRFGRYYSLWPSSTSISTSFRGSPISTTTPAMTRWSVAGIRTGKSKGASLFMLHLAQFNPGVRILNTSISSEQAKIVYHDMLEVIGHGSFQALGRACREEPLSAHSPH
jgi:hypothetical protein